MDTASLEFVFLWASILKHGKSCTQVQWAEPALPAKSYRNPSIVAIVQHG